MPTMNRSWTVVRATWLTRKPTAGAWIGAAWSVILLFFGSIAYWQDIGQASQWMAASGAKVFTQHEYWRLWTTLFAHGDGGHLISNSFLFLIFGYFLAGYFGIFVFPLLAMFVGGLTNAIVLRHYPAEVSLIGVSGVVYWMGGMWLVLYLLLDEQRSFTQRILRSIGVSLAVFMPSAAFDPQISYGAHLVGFVLGVASGFIYYFARKKTFAAAVVREIVVEDDAPAPSGRSDADEATPLGPPRVH